MTKPSLSFAASSILATAGTFVALGGLASMQAFCDANGSIIPGVKPQYQAAAKIKYAGQNCPEFFRFEWWGWVLQMTFLFIAFACYLTKRVHVYKSALWSLATAAIVLAMYQADDLIDLYHKTQGDLHSRGVVTFVGYVAFCTGSFLMMFSGEALYHKVRGQKDSESDDSKMSA